MPKRTKIEKSKTSAGKYTIKHKSKGGKDILTFKDVEYKTKTSPRSVYKDVEVLDKRGTTSYKTKKEGGKVVGKETSFTPKKKIQIKSFK